MILSDDIDVGQVLEDGWMAKNIHLMTRREMIMVISMIRDSYNQFIEDMVDIGKKFDGVEK
tara:strand:- start:707 stop:889 length:183 start_codon:yes stop_codon:yes gene_type:complete